MKIFLCGDMMLGRGIDQVLPFSCPPQIFEGYMKSALGYVRLAEQKNGPVSAPVDFPYVWGDALAVLDRARPDARIINLETAVTLHDQPTPKGINYRMHPGNVRCLKAAKIDCCSLSNNHVLDWGREGLLDSLAALDGAGIAHSGAGKDQEQADAPAIIPTASGRVVVFSFSMSSSGVPASWAAGPARSGVCYLPDLSQQTAQRIAAQVARSKGPGDIAVASIHWGPNWGYQVLPEEIAFAHMLVDNAGIDVVHGHSSHHPKPMEVHKGRLILYGCGDFINDYEGISGHEEFRSDLGLMYLASLGEDGRLLGLHMVPTQMKQLQVRRAMAEDALWMMAVLNREGQRFGTRYEMDAEGQIVLRWD